MGQPIILPELDVFIHLLILLRLIDEKRMEKVKKGHRDREGCVLSVFHSGLWEREGELSHY